MFAHRREAARWTAYTPVITWTLVTAYVAIGAGLVGQPARFSNTPSYANLLVFAPACLWGVIYLTTAALLAGWRFTRRWWCGVAAHTLAATLTTSWLAAFVIRYLTDAGTTIVNVVSWSVFLSLVIRSLFGLDDEGER